MSAQPQLAGRCLNPMTMPPSGSGTPCDFFEQCLRRAGKVPDGRGCPKYGDYNGNAAAAGRHYSAWTSFVTPVGAAAGTGLRVFTSTDLLPSDFFVRDWTASALSHDGGAQPSTNPVFWATSDLWNQSTNVAVPFPAADWILGDPPSRVGSNFAFARVSRRAAAASTAAAPAAVTVTFLQADYGLGVAYSIVGSQAANFAAGDMTRVTPGCRDGAGDGLHPPLPRRADHRPEWRHLRSAFAGHPRRRPVRSIDPDRQQQGATQPPGNGRHRGRHGDVRRDRRTPRGSPGLWRSASGGRPT